MPEHAAPIFDALVRGALIACLLLLAAQLLRHAASRPAARLGAALCAGQTVQAIQSLPLVEASAPAWLPVPLVAISVANGVLFWLFVCTLFERPAVPLGLVTTGQDRWLEPRFHGMRVADACGPCERIAHLQSAGHGALLRRRCRRSN